jgi:serine carboxypeptidase 1
MRWQWQDNPVGTGFSYVEGGDRTLLARTDAEAATDLTTLLSQLYRSNNTRLQGSPLYIVAESYGGKFAVTTALAALKAIHAGRLAASLAGTYTHISTIAPFASISTHIHSNLFIIYLHQMNVYICKQ